MKKNPIDNSYFVVIYFLFFIFASVDLFSQVENVPVTHPVYEYLKTMQVKKIIPDYNSSMIPISRSEIAEYLKVIGKEKKLTGTEKKQLEDFRIEFEYDLSKTLEKSSSLLTKFDASSIFGNKKQKYLYNYTDSNAALFLDLSGNVYSRNAGGDIEDKSVLIGNLGLGVRGTLFDKIGYSLNIFEGKRFTGSKSDLQFAVDNDPVLKSNPDFINNNNFSFFTGSLRYRTNANWFSIIFGREALNCGFGYADKLFFSNNTVPFDFLKLELNYKKLKYTFAFGSIKGDSLGIDLKSKNISFHRLNVRFSDFFKAGFFESVVMSNNPFSFVYFNPLSFITSADLNTGAKETTENNTLMGLDFEINPVKNIALQSSLLIDDINFSTMFKSDSTSFDNKFGYQVGAVWTDAFTVPDIKLILEYTRLNPFIYSHRSNKNSYTNWDLALGHALPPNSDEISIKLIYNITNRIRFSLLYQFQRSGQGIYYDSIEKKIINYGGNINRGDGDNYSNIKFLDGDRINRNILTLDIILEPIKQYFIEIQYQYRFNNLIYLSRKTKESYIWVNIRFNL